jgi:hypothetical protein
MLGREAAVQRAVLSGRGMRLRAMTSNNQQKVRERRGGLVAKTGRHGSGGWDYGGGHKIVCCILVMSEKPLLGLRPSSQTKD